jgi:hypothetical protein
MRSISTVLASLLVATLLVTSSGCNKDRDSEYYYQERRQSGGTTSAQSAKPYPITEQNGIKFAVLAKGAVVTSNINGWRAITPEFFNKMTAITVKVPEEDKTYHPGMGYVIPRIEASEKYPERKLTGISAGYLVPKELHGWVAMDQATFDKVTSEWMTGDAKKPANTQTAPKN